MGKAAMVEMEKLEDMKEVDVDKVEVKKEAYKEAARLAADEMAVEKMAVDNMAEEKMAVGWEAEEKVVKKGEVMVEVDIEVTGKAYLVKAKVEVRKVAAIEAVERLVELSLIHI